MIIEVVCFVPYVIVVTEWLRFQVHGGAVKVHVEELYEKPSTSASASLENLVE